MFFHMYKYRLKRLLNSKVVIFWTALFPIILGTLFYIAFDELLEQEKLKVIPVAVVTENAKVDADNNQENNTLNELLKNLSKEGENKQLDITWTTKSEAETLLQSNLVDGIIINSNEPYLIVKNSGLNQSILKSILDISIQTTKVVQDTLLQHPENLEQVILSLTQKTEYIRNKTVSLNGNQVNTILQYYFALIAMAALYGSQFGLLNANEVQGNMSAVAARKGVSPSKKSVTVISEFLAALTIQFMELLILLFYLIKVLGISFGNNLGPVILTTFVSSMFGVAMGTFIGVIIKKGESVKLAVTMGVSMLLSFFSGLMFSGMKLMIEHNAPWFNRINPATLIADAFYSLSVYDNYSRFGRNIISLTVLTLLLCLFSSLLLRREKYASL